MISLAWIRRWSPISLSFKRGLGLSVGYVGRPFTVYARVHLHLGWDRTSELPGLSVSLSLWRLRLYAGVGHGWQDEDGENRSLIHAGATLQTYGLRWIGCWRGHKPETSDLMPGYVWCERCDHTIETVNYDKPQPAAAA